LIASKKRQCKRVLEYFRFVRTTRAGARPGPTPVGPGMPRGFGRVRPAGEAEPSRERLRPGRRLGRRTAGGEAPGRLGPGGPLADEIAGVGREGPEAVDPAGRPANLDRLDLVGVSEAEMEAGVAGGLVAAAAEPPGDARPAAGGHADPRPDGVAVRGGALETEG